MSAVLITGAAGFIGKELARSISATGKDVVGITRSGSPLPHTVAVYRASLGESIDHVFREYDIHAVVHAANDTSHSSLQINVEGTRRWFDDACNNGVSLQILLSSLSAAPDAASAYGQSKNSLEHYFIDRNQMAFRLGLVIGIGGMFEAIVKSLRWPIVPLLDGGYAKVYFIGIARLCEILNDTIEGNGKLQRAKVWNLQQPEPCLLRDILRTTREVYQKRCLFLPVPSLPILWGLSILERLPISLAISTANIKGLRQARFKTFESDYGHFADTTDSLESLVKAAYENS